jgi:hypothetical protein
MTGLTPPELLEIPDESSTRTAAGPRVLTSGSGMEGRMAVVQYGDGTLAITFPQQPERGELRWPPGQLDDCMHAYLCLLRRRAPEA